MSSKSLSVIKAELNSLVMCSDMNKALGLEQLDKEVK